MAGLIEPNQVGKREDLANIIARVDAHNTPVTSMIPKGKKLTNTLFDWQLDAYRAPTISGVVDGEDATSFENKAARRKRTSGRLQKKWEKWMVSDMSENISDVAGLTSEKARSQADAIVELKRGIEAVICGDQDSQVQDGTDPYLTRGLGSWIKASAQTDLPVPSDYLTPSGSINSTAMASLTETLVQDVLESVWTKTGKIGSYMMPCGSKLKRAFTGFSQYVPDKASNTAIRTFEEGSSRKLTATIDVYEGDFGTIELHPCNWLAYDASGATSATTRRGYLLDMALLELRFGRMPRTKELEDKGGGPRGIVDAIFGLCVKSPLGLGKFAATS